MRLYAPETTYNDQTMKYYLTYLTKWLLSYQTSLAPPSSSLEIKFEYIIERLAKSNLLSLIVGIVEDKKILEIMNKFLNIQEEKCYEPKSEIFSNFVLIITGVLEDMTDIPTSILNVLLIHLNRKNNKDKYELCKAILVKMKNFLAAPINELIISNGKINIKDHDFCVMIKELSKINFEFLVKFFLKIPKKINKEKINGARYFDILLHVFSTENSFEIAIRYKHLFSNLLDQLNSNKSENKYKIFKTLSKFLSRNKLKSTENNFFAICEEKIKQYLKEMKTESNALNALYITKKIKKWKLIKLISLTLLSSPYTIVYKTAMKYIFEIINEKIFGNFNIYDLNSVDKLKLLNKSSKLFTSILEKMSDTSNDLNEQFNLCLKQLFDNEPNNSIGKLIILFYFAHQNVTMISIWNQIILAYYSTSFDNENQKDNILFNIFNDNEKQFESMLDFFSLYITNVDEEINKNSITVLISMIYVIVYFVKYHIYTNLIMNSDNITSKIIRDIKLIITNKLTNNDVFTAQMILLKQMLYVPQSDENSKNELYDLIQNDIANFVLENEKINVKAFCVVFYELNSLLTDKVILPSKFNEFLSDSSKYMNTLKFINEILKLDKKGLYTSIFFNENTIKYLLYDLKEKIFSDTKNEQIKITTDEKDKIAKHNVIKLISGYHEILKYQFYHLIKVIKEKEKDNYNKEINQFIKFILSAIYNFFEKEYVDIEKLSKKKKKKFNHTYSQIQLLCIAKYINLIFKFYENEIQIKSSYQIKIMNLLLCKDFFIRNHFIQKINKKITKGSTSLNYYLNIIPMLTIAFADPDKSLQRLSNGIISSFISHIFKKLQKINDINDNSAYKYIPEVYLSYIIVYFVFNRNLNILFQIADKKELSYFSEIIISFFKIIKRQCENKIDSDFILRLLSKIKGESLKERKEIKNIFSNGLYLVIDKDDDDNNDIQVDYELVKNDICEFVKRIVSSQFMSDFSHGNIKPKLPIIFIGVEKNGNSIKRESVMRKTFVLDTTKILMTASAIKSKKKDFHSGSGQNKENMKDERLNEEAQIRKISDNKEGHQDIINAYQTKSRSKKKI